MGGIHHWRMFKSCLRSYTRSTAFHTFNIWDIVIGKGKAHFGKCSDWLLLEFNNLTTYSSPFKRKFYTAITFIKINTDSYSFSFALSPSLSLTHTQRLEEKERSERPWYKCINAKRKELKSWIVVLVCEYPGKWSWPLISLWRLFCHWLNS